MVTNISTIMEKRIKISSKVDNLRLVEKIIDEISAACNISSEIYGNILIASLEAVNNAIVHGNKMEEKKQVEIVFSCKDNVIKLEVEDQGPGFDFSSIPDPTAPENIENINGRGIFLMEKLSDKITFFNEGRKVQMIFNI
jgi:serine/threonine-protein kinase RsbW